MAQRGGKRPGSGRKKGEATLLAQQARNFIASELEKNLKPIVDRAINDAKLGDKAARDWLSERGWGKVVQVIATEDEDGKIQPITGIIINNPNGEGKDS